MKKITFKLAGIFVLVFVATLIFLNVFSINIKNINAETTETTPSVEILKNNVSYSDSIYIAYAVYAEGFKTNKYEVQLLFWEQKQEEYTKGTELYIGTEKGKTNIDEKQCLVFYSNGLAAKNMTDDLVARAYVVIDEVEYYSEPMKFSVLEYVYKMKDSGSLNPHQKRLLETMLSYGGAAQDNFGYNTDRKADSEYFCINLYGGIHSDGFNHGLYQKGDKLKIKAEKPQDGYKFSHWIDKDKNIVGDEAEIEIEVDGDNDYEAIYKPIETIILKDNLTIDEPYDATASTLSLPDYVTVNNAEDVEETIEVLWDTTTFVPNQIGEQIIYGTFVNSDYQLEKPLSIKVNIFPYTFTLDVDNQTYVINKYYGTSSVETIPGTFKGLPINTIKAYAFNEVTTLTNLVIPTTITSIEQGAIYLCDNLEKITIPFFGTSPTDDKNVYVPFGLIFGASSEYDQAAFIPTNLKHVVLLDSITFIPSNAFYHCSGIQSIKLPSTLTKIGYQSFYECQLLSEITLPSSVSSVDLYAFKNCISLQNVYFEGTLEKWCNISFESAESNPMYYANDFYLKDLEGKYQVVTEIEIPNSILEIGNYQFIGFKNLSKITFPSTLVAIKQGSFKNCSSLTSITLPESLGLVGGYAFEQCTMLAEVEILSTRLTEIGDYAFSNCIFEEFDIPSTLQYLGAAAFKECINLTEVTLPVGITEIKDDTFKNCMNLISVETNGIIVSIGYSAFESCENLKSVEVKEGLISIGELAFYQCYSLSNFTFPTTLSSIGEWAFLDCSSLTSISLTNNITRIENLTFRGCSSVETVVLPDTLEYLGSSAFDGCSKIKSINIPSGFQVIKNHTFNGCESLENVIIPEGVTTIEDYVFNSCKQFTSITIPEGVTSIGERAFSGCINLTEVKFPSTLETIGAYAFNNCGFETIELPESLTTIGEYVFSNSSLIEIEIPSSVTVISKSCFYNCSELTNVKLPESVKIIGVDAFRGCRNLSSINLENVESIGEYAFYYDLSLENIVLGENLTSIGTNAFNGCSKLFLIYNLSDLELTIGSTDNGYVAYYAKYIHNELPREISLKKEVAYDATVETLELPESITVVYNEEEISLDVTWDTTTFVVNQIGEQVIYGVFNDDESYDKYNIKRGCIIYTINVLPYTFSLEETTNEYTLTKYYGTEEEVVIPDAFNNISITSIGNSAFLGCMNLKNILIPEGVKNIGEYAFDCCINLTSINIPSSLTSIGKYAFNYCVNLISIIIPSNVINIGECAFYYCTNTIINCEITSQPEGFDENWNLVSSDVYGNVVFGYSPSEEE